MLTLGQTLSFYKRKDIQKLIVESSQDKEIGVRFNESFGKRPDIIKYDNDVFEFAKLGATSFHCSEELWNNPLGLNANLKRNELDDLRKGWDLILDIDCPYWDFSKITTYVFIKALKDHKIESVTVKFSGGKGFHIAVPFEAFPLKIAGQEVKNLFPEGPRKIAEYLLHYINTNLIKVDSEGGKIQFAKVSVAFSKLLKDTGKTESDLIKTICASCKKEIKMESLNASSGQEFICPYCETRVKDDASYMKCPKCSRLMEKKISKKSLCSCGSNKVEKHFDLSSIVNVDTVLISSRHLYRMAYSMHEKTGLISVPFDIKHILAFDKEEALPSKVKKYKYLEREGVRSGEASELFQKAFDFKPESASKEKQDIKSKFDVWKKESTKSFEDTQAIPEEFFPPCIKKISQGIEDGKKRALFILINFLGSCNWDYEKMEEYIMKWNEKNKPEKLKETYVKGQLRYYKQQASLNNKMPPPNCDNRGYMVDTQFCNPDGLCRNIKNPVQYAKKKVWLNNNAKPQKKTKKSSVSKDEKND